MAFDLKSIITSGITEFAKGVSDIAHSWISTKKDQVIDDAASKEFEFKVQQFAIEAQQKAIDAMNAAQAAEDVNVTDRWKADMASDSWLSKNIRPLVLACLLGFTFLIITFDSLHFRFKVDAAWVSMIQELLMTVFIAYFTSRGIEKIQSIKANKT